MIIKKLRLPSDGTHWFGSDSVTSGSMFSGGAVVAVLPALSEEAAEKQKSIVDLNSFQPKHAYHLLMALHDETFDFHSGPPTKPAPGLVLSVKFMDGQSYQACNTFDDGFKTTKVHWIGSGGLLFIVAPMLTVIIRMQVDPSAKETKCMLFMSL